MPHSTKTNQLPLLASPASGAVRRGSHLRRLGCRRRFLAHYLRRSGYRRWFPAHFHRRSSRQLQGYRQLQAMCLRTHRLQS